MARGNRGIIIALVVFVVIAAVVRFFGDPLYDMFVQLHGRPPGGH